MSNEVNDVISNVRSIDEPVLITSCLKMAPHDYQQALCNFRVSARRRMQSEKRSCLLKLTVLSLTNLGFRGDGA
jgi:hypothetical protein